MKFVEPKITKKILKQAREQQNDDDEMSDDLLSDTERPRDNADSDEDAATADIGENFVGDDMQYESHLVRSR